MNNHDKSLICKWSDVERSGRVMDVIFTSKTLFHESSVLKTVMWLSIHMLIQEQHLSVSGERNVHKGLVTCLWDVFQVITDHPDMTIAVDHGRKALNKQISCSSRRWMDKDCKYYELVLVSN